MTSFFLKLTVNLNNENYSIIRKYEGDHKNKKHRSEASKHLYTTEVIPFLLDEFGYIAPKELKTAQLTGLVTGELIPTTFFREIGVGTVECYVKQ